MATGGTDPSAQAPAIAAPSALPVVLLIGMLWGLNWPAVKFMLTEMPPLTIRGLALPFAAALLLIYALIRGERLRPERGEIPAIIANGMLALTDNLYVIWAMIIFFLLFVGMFMETLAAILILVPVMLPVAYSMGIDPIHFGVVMVATLGIGFQTPPLGENLFIASGISKISIEEISLRALPFALVNTIAIFILAFFPQLTLWLPDLLGY